MNSSFPIATPLLDFLVDENDDDDDDDSNDSSKIIQQEEKQQDNVRIIHIKCAKSKEELEEHDVNEDTWTKIICSWKILENLGIINKSLVMLRNPNSNQCRYGRIFASNVKEEEEEIVVSPMQFFNLGFHKDEKSGLVQVSPYLHLSTSTCPVINEHSLKVAKNVTLSRVKNGKTSAYTSYHEELQNYFSKVPRILCLGDLIAVPIDLDPKNIVDIKNDNSKEKEYDNNSNNSIKAVDINILTGKLMQRPYEIGFFYVAEISSDDDDDNNKGFIVDVLNASTQVISAGTTNTIVPDLDVISLFISSTSTIIASTMKENEKAIIVDEKVSSFTSLYNQILLLAEPAVQGENSRITIHLTGSKGTGKTLVARSIANRLGIHIQEFSLAIVRGLPEDQVVKELQIQFDLARENFPCILLLKDLACLSRPANATANNAKPDDPDQIVSTILLNTLEFRRKNLEKSRNILLIATSLVPDDVPSVLRGCFTHEIPVDVPNVDTRLDILKYLIKLRRMQIDTNTVSLDSLAKRTAGRTAIELKALLTNAGMVTLKRNGDKIVESDLESALDTLPASSSSDIGAPKIPNVFWDDVGGLGEAKDEIMNMIQLPLHHPELFSQGLKQRSGILLYGPPGTGKTLLAKAVATECSLNFISVKGPELLDMYIGESERKVREVFNLARSAKPCVLFFDELDSLAPQRGRGSDGGGVMDRVVSQLLSELDGMSSNSSSSDVFVIGATNRPDLLDQSLLRPGRFDRLIYLGISKDKTSQMKIVKALTRKYVHDDLVNLEQVLNKCPLTFTGADFYALCSNAMANALGRRVNEIKLEIEKYNENILKEQGENSLYLLTNPRKYLSQMDENDLNVKVKMEDYEKALASTIPSVSEQEIKHYESLREKFSAPGKTTSTTTTTTTN